MTYAVEGGNIYFDPTTGEIASSDSSVTAADIPSSINGVSVTKIGASAFKSCYALTSVTIPDSVASIGSGAFNNCTALAGITIPAGVTSIETSAFSGCKSLSCVYYGGNEAQWNNISIKSGNSYLTDAAIRARVATPYGQNFSSSHCDQTLINTASKSLEMSGSIFLLTTFISLHLTEPDHNGSRTLPLPPTHVRIWSKILVLPKFP